VVKQSQESGNVTDIMAESVLENATELLDEFAVEAIGQLRDAATQLARCPLGTELGEPIHAVFRAIHSIKGNASFFGLTSIKRYAHAVENTLDELRKGKLRLSESLARALLESFDNLDELVNEALAGQAGEELSDREAQSLLRLERESQGCASESGTTGLDIDVVRRIAQELASLDDPRGIGWAQQLQAMLPPEAEMAPSLSKLRPADLRGQRLTCEQMDVTELIAPLLEFFWAIDASGVPGETTAFLQTALQLVPWARTLGRESLATALTQAAVDLQRILDSPLDLDATLVECVWETLAPELAQLVLIPEAPQDAEQPLPVESPGEAPRSAVAEAAPAKGRMVRIREDRLDEFMDHVSRLFITCELFKDLHARMTAAGQMSPLVEELRQVSRGLATQSSSLQQSLVSLRRVAASNLFAKFPKLARGLAHQLGKQVDVRLEGEDVEIDKQLIEELDAPLTHMVRNVVDHGIESPDERQTRGVFPTGTLTLRAEVSRTHVGITIEDDGRGIDPQRLRQKGIEKGIVTAARAGAMSDAEALDLIFEPGFSTAEKLSDVSGRGVGLDVVRSKLRELNGEVTLQSQVGVGTRFRLELPLREAVLVTDSLMIRHGGQEFAIPFTHILEVFEIDSGALHTVHGWHTITVRGKTYDAVSLGKVLEIADNTERKTCAAQGVLVTSKFGEACLIAEEVAGHRQVVVNSLRRVLGGVDRIAGVAQLGGGRMALALSIPDIVRGLARQGEV
jgi:two-component system chemotaxis sensor kinase CheA